MLGVASLFLALNYQAWDGYFQDDELDTLSWAPSYPLAQFAIRAANPFFELDNFRPTGHLYFALMGRAFGLNFPPWVTPVFAAHFVNAALLFLILRKLNIGRWHGLAGSTFFLLSATAFDAYWKPMYVFDLFCATFSMGSLLLWMYRRPVLSFIAFWLAYKSKELAVTLPAVLAIYEYWLGERRYVRLIPFFATSLSFGLQGIFLNPNKNNDYTIRFTLAALEKTIPFYARRFLFLPFSGLALAALVFVRDRRVWFGLAASLLFAFTLFFLPGRLFEAYAYLPMVGAVIALSAAASRLSPVWAWVALAVWMPWNVREIRHEKRALLHLDDVTFEYVHTLERFAAHHPEIRTLVFTPPPRHFHDWGVTGAWNIMHNAMGLDAWYQNSAEAVRALREQTVAYAVWNFEKQTLTVQIHSASDK